MAYNPNYTQWTLTQETYNFKKHYDDKNIYVVFAIPNFSIKLGSTRPIFVCFLKQRGEQFGDPLAAPIGEGQTILFRISDNTNCVVVNSTMTQTDDNRGEWIYEFNTLDFSETGKYTGEIILLENGVESTLDKFYLNVI